MSASAASATSGKKTRSRMAAGYSLALDIAP
jgi:hypothetical protein